MKNKIKILPDFIANQIAAGEVVQRPESVVKELIENSLDAGASEITILVKNAGKSLIHIIDNGVGMEKEDLLLSVKRHATSKLIDQKDLEAIKTFGFRGEALASIASVANLEIVSKTKDSEVGLKLISEPNRGVEIEELNASIGTQILVRNLFLNTPARRKFLKTNITEFRHISETVVKFALANPDKRFVFYNDDNLIFDLKSKSQYDRIIDLLGRTYEDLLIEINYEEEGIKVKGYVGKPFIAKNTSGEQFMFLNKRIIRSRYLNHSVYSCYEDIIENKQYPFYCIFINLDFEKVDVNVHPQKNEVKFEDEKLVYNIIRRAVSKALREENLIPQLNIESGETINPFIRLKNHSDEDILINRDTGEFTSFPKKQDSRLGQSDGYKKSGHNFDYRNEKADIRSSDLRTIEDIFSEEDNNQVLGYLEINNRYIFLKQIDSVLVIHKRRAQQRILFEKLLKDLEGGKLKSQDLLFKENIELSINDITIVESNKTLINDLGFDYKIEGQTLSLDAIPNFLEHSETKSIFSIVCEILSKNKESEISEILKHLSILAYRTSIKSNQMENEKIIYELLKIEKRHINPLGKLVIFEIPYTEIEKKFNS